MVLKDVTYLNLSCFDLNRSYDLTNEGLVQGLAEKLKPLLYDGDSFYKNFEKVDQRVFPPGYRRRRKLIRARLKDFRITDVPLIGEKSLESMTIRTYLTVYSSGTAVVQQWQVPRREERSVEDLAAFRYLYRDPTGRQTVRLESPLSVSGKEIVKKREVLYFYPYKVLKSLDPKIEFSQRHDVLYGPMKYALGTRYPGFNTSGILLLSVDDPRGSSRGTEDYCLIS